MTAAIATEPAPDILGAAHSGAPEQYVELVRALLDYEREHEMFPWRI